MTTSGLALSGLFVLLSVLVIPAWRNKHRSGTHAGAVRALSLLALAAATAATTWLTWQVVSLGVHDTGPQTHGHSFLGSIFGVPVIVIPLAVLVAVVGVAELLARTVRTAPVPSSSGSAHMTAATAVPIEQRSRDLREQYRQELAGAAPRQGQVGWRDASGNRELFGRFRHREERTLDAIRAELAAAGVHSRAVLADAITQIESRLVIGLEQHAQIQASTLAAVGSLHEAMIDSATSVNLALDGVAERCAMVADRIEAHRLERPALAEAVALLTRPVAITRDVPSAIVPVAGTAIVAEGDVVPNPVGIKPVDERWRDRANEGDGALTSVQRLRQRAKNAARVWTRARPRPSRTGPNPSA
ncbi:MAG: hypothetical protein ACLPVY_01650 [Acidimicrobiia bacterium]